MFLFKKELVGQGKWGVPPYSFLSIPFPMETDMWYEPPFSRRLMPASLRPFSSASTEEAGN